MVRSQTKSRLADRIAKEDARKESRYAEPKPLGGGSLPSGIENGIAKLTRVDFDTIENGRNAGSQRFYCHGICVQPKVHDNVKCEGRLVQPGMITLDDVKSDYGDSTFAENVAKAEERLKRLGFPTEEFEDIENDTLNYFETGEEMYFEFRTWSPSDSDRVLIQIAGPAEWVARTEDDVEESEPAAAASNTASPPAAEALVEETLRELAVKADAGDEKAQLAIVKQAEARGIDPEDDSFDKWADVADAIETVDEGEGVSVEVGDVFRYAKEDTDCQVLEVSGDSVKLKSLVDDQEYEGVSVGDLEVIA